MGWLIGGAAALLLVLLRASVWTRWSGRGLVVSIGSVPGLLAIGWVGVRLLLLGQPQKMYDLRAMWPLGFVLFSVPWLVLGLIGWAGRVVRRRIELRCEEELFSRPHQCIRPPVRRRRVLLPPPFLSENRVVFRP